MAYIKRKIRNVKNRFEFLDLVLLLVLSAFALIIIIPFINVVAISFSSHKEYLDTALLLVPKRPIIKNYERLFADGRIWIGYRTTLIFLMIGVPVNMFLTISVAYGLTRPGFPGKKIIFYGIIFTMLFNGGIVPMYLLMRELKLTNTIWSVVFAYGINSFYMIIMRSYFMTIPESLMESAKLDGASEWRILFQLILPLSMPIIATIILFYSVDRWNEWYNAMIFIRKNNLVPLQLILRSIVLETRVTDNMAVSAAVIRDDFVDGMKMACVIVVMLPVMCVFPFLQRYFVKGVLIGAIKA
ncbi:MAG: carbohydrate ABC transporter permease [Treponema sp.]|jgi:putative aldouronate transport system permease protein|nr:carbohydrate ABC transporter permease [Treponema sp.]